MSYNGSMNGWGSFGLGPTPSTPNYRTDNMANEISGDTTAELLKQRLVEQDELEKRFDAARPAEDYKDEINLGGSCRLVTAFRMDKNAFLVKHLPTEIISQWPVTTGPGRLKTVVEKWVDEIQIAGQKG